ncbi:sigma-70 family RNA polymerase sigma factor [bacterium]|nr:sigma-70 family RNA polymerase sigma factor [bacterium]
MTEPDDATLVARAQNGDQEAFGDLVARHQRAMYAIGRAYMASEADAEDAVQDAFVKAFLAIGQLNASHKFAGWMARITANTCLDTLRTRKDKVSLADFATSVPLRPRIGPHQLTPSTLASQSEETQMLRAAIGRLPDPQRVAIMLRYGGCLSYEQIAAYLDAPVTTVDSRLHKAKLALRKMLKTLDSLGS